MKKIMALFLFLFVLFSLNAEFYVGLDTRSVDSFFRESARIDIETGFNTKSTNIIFPFRYGKSFSYDLSFFETGVLVSVYPVEEIGFFAEASLFKVGFMWGLYAPNEVYYLSSEVSLGWEFRFNSFYIKPRYTMRSSLSSEDSKTERLKTIVQFSERRLSLTIGIIIGGKND